jgi:EAL domain-containing protein (putative c-di-GMP-specific phosphodiesterase class I)
VPSVAVNFSEDEMRDPALMEKIKWELDRFELSPDRLTIEVLEGVVAEADDDIITKNVAKLCDIGCRLDLDDFGTGQASIAAIRRFKINRIKIDRSFVARIDEDPEQQKLLSSILMMVERLKLEAIAEGVESLGERSVLEQLGCEHIQGYGIARPMPFKDTLIWIADHNEKLNNSAMFLDPNGDRNSA